jgi:hypothetical protein
MRLQKYYLFFNFKVQNKKGFILYQD